MRSEAVRKRRVEKKILRKIFYHHQALRKMRLAKRKSLCLVKMHNIIYNNNKRLTFDTNLYQGSN